MTGLITRYLLASIIKQSGCIIIIMQRLHEDDLVGHLLDRGFGNWKVLRFPAIAEEDEVHEIRTPFGCIRQVIRRAGEALHPEREPLDVLHEIRLRKVNTTLLANMSRHPLLLVVEWSNLSGSKPSVWRNPICSFKRSSKAGTPPISLAS